MAQEKISFNKPASQWDEVLPLGNGRLGAMIFGVPDREKIQLNEDSIWSGAFCDRNNPAAKDALPEIRRLLNEGRAAEAEEICLECFSGTPPAQRVYQTAGELQINFSPDGGFGLPWSGTRGGPLLENVSNYRRKLDISKALHTLSFEYQNTLFARECFISAAANLMVLRFTAASLDGKPALGKISFRACLDRGVFYDGKGNIEDAAFLSRNGDIPFCSMFKVVQKGGTQRGRGGFITVENADEAVLFLDIRTNFLNANQTDCFDAALANINLHAARGWEELLQEHIEEYQLLYNRLQLTLCDEQSTMNSQTFSPDFVVKYFNFCRYLLISCSRPGTNPANLQGLWNHHIDPPWGCGYTININTQMNYWPACSTNLAETEYPLFDLLERMYPNGKHTAQVMYGCRGFVAHHNTDIWGDTAPRDYWLPGSYWVLGAAWLSLHIWEHYEYTLDKDFLKKYFYLLEEACLFFADFLTPANDGKKNEDGEVYLVVSPSVSPENSYVFRRFLNAEGTESAKDSENVKIEIASLCAGCGMDNQILRKLFSVTVRAAEILDMQNEDTKQFRSILKRIADPQIHSNGTIREWNEEYEEAEPGHRHFSHLFALWPGGEIAGSKGQPELAVAARKSIESRLAADGGHTGWSRAWLVNFFARLGDGDAALEHLNAIFKDFTLPNLFNTHPPFQIDGNFGALAGITQMLVQSRIREDGTVIVELLPALPREWKNGSIKGARIKGNMILDFEWKEGKLTSLSVNNMGHYTYQCEFVDKNF